MKAVFDSNILIDYLKGIPSAAQEINQFENKNISIISYIEVLVGLKENDTVLAQAIGADYTFANGTKKKAVTMGNIGTTSFFPSKNLGGYGDGGALYTNDDELAKKCRMIVNHGQSKQYYYEMLGVNSRLDSIQASILKVKLKSLDSYAASRNKAAAYYDKAFAGHLQGSINRLFPWF